MSTAALTMVLTAAVLHALWNLAAKGVRGDPVVFVWLYFTAKACLLLPLALVQIIIQNHSFGWELLYAPVVTAILHIAYSVLLQVGYRQADLGIVYPIARGTGPLLAVLAAVALLGERPSSVALTGGIIIIGGILVVTGARLFRRTSGLSTGLFYGLATGTAIAGYTLWDDLSVTTLAIPPLIYYGLGCVAQSLVMLPWVVHRRAQLALTLRTNRRQVAAVAVLSPAAYLLVLYALQTTSVALVAPVRESSIVIGSLMAWWLFREPDPVRRILGAGVVAIGIGLVATG
ncbi:DMT family transporter [Nesterenkonia alba]|uniref:DMT family transporter n=1 Tax=Nesterenkonia alba TaxID=515814 RepID=UPI0003B4AC97|nr:DMT family transporter [Nesterenkonia alba]